MDRTLIPLRQLESLAVESGFQNVVSQRLQTDADVFADLVIVIDNKDGFSLQLIIT